MSEKPLLQNDDYLIKCNTHRDFCKALHYSDVIETLRKLINKLKNREYNISLSDEPEVDIAHNDMISYALADIEECFGVLPKEEENEIK